MKFFFDSLVYVFFFDMLLINGKVSMNTEEELHMV